MWRRSRLTFWSRTALRTIRYSWEPFPCRFISQATVYRFVCCPDQLLNAKFTIKIFISPPGFYLIRCSPFLRRSTVILCPSSLRQEIFGVGKPSALQVKLMFWFSRTATVDWVLSASRMFGGTEKFKTTRFWGAPFQSNFLNKKTCPRFYFILTWDFRGVNYTRNYEISL